MSAPSLSKNPIATMIAASPITLAISISMTAIAASPSDAYPRYRYDTRGNTPVMRSRQQFNKPPKAQVYNPPATNVRSNEPVAQVFRSTISLPVGQQIATKLNRQDTLYINKGETVSASLIVAQDIATSNGTIVIPAGAVIEGQFVPVEGGSKFVAQKFTSRGATVGLQAESALINDIKDPRETNAGSILTDAGIGGAAGAVLGGVLRGNVQIIDVLGGAAAAVIVGNVTAPQVTVIEPNMVVNVITKQSLTFAVRDDY